MNRRLVILTIPSQKHKLEALFRTVILLFLSDGFDRANLGTGPAIRAFILADHVGFALLDSADGTFLSTRSTRNAFFSYDISHVPHLPFSSSLESGHATLRGVLVSF